MSTEERSDLPGEEEVVASNPNANGPDGAAGGMGVSSERVGDAGAGQHATDGMRDTSPGPSSEHPEEVRPEQSQDSSVEPNPDYPGPPVSGYPSRNPNSKDAPYDPGTATDVGR